MVREDLITSAVSFLQDPSVANAPVEKRIAFLQSKNLTQEEIDVSLARAASDDPSQPASPAPQYSSPPSNAYRPPPAAPAYGGGYPPQYWPQQAPPEPPKRDWRDYFIMATVMGGVGYGLYFTAKRYILPVISPPTAPQLEQDKASIDESFERAFDLLEQLNTDTQALKESEEARTSRLDNALGEVESVLASLKESSKRQGDDNRRIEDDVRGLRDLIPKALDAQKEANDTRLKELSTELKSLKTLVGNRMSAPAPARPAQHRPQPDSEPDAHPGPDKRDKHTRPAAPTEQPNGAPNGSTSTETPAPAMPGGASTGAANGTASAAAAEKPVQSWRGTQGRAAIPAWQLAAKKSEESKKDTSASGTVEASSS
ncbi:peroxisomal membrane protein pex14 [Didymella sp. IMI 355093]|nr:peroxisomal membrane protein pex14 [Didymella sp. IMI 355093]